MPSIIGLVAATVLHGPNRPVLRVAVPPFVEFQDMGVLAPAKPTPPPAPDSNTATTRPTTPIPASVRELLKPPPVSNDVKSVEEVITAPMKRVDTGSTVAKATPTSPITTMAGLMASRNVPYSSMPLLPQTSQGEFGMNKRISISAENLELSQVIKGIANQAKVNIILASKDNPQVNITLQEMPLPNALRLLSAVAGMKFILVGDTFIFGSDDVLKANFPEQFAVQYPGVKEPVKEIITETYTTTYISASDAVQALQSSLTGAKINYAVGPSQIVPSGMGSGSYSGSTGSTGGSGGAGGSTVGGTSQSGGAHPGGATGSTGSTGSGVGNSGGTSRTIILNGEKDSVEQALSILRSLDVARPQVHIDVRMDDVSNDALRDLGTSWTFSNETITERSTNDFHLQVFDRTPLSFAAVISALENSNKAKVLSAPNLTLLDQQTGYVLIGNRINYPVITSTNSQGNPIFDVKEVDVGVYMQVSASVSDSGEVTLWLYPQVSSITGYLQVNGGQYPQISTRETQSTIRVKSGQTVVMAGLIQESEIKAWQQVPGFGDIPIIGELFKRRTTTRTSSQIIVSITPTIIR